MEKREYNETVKYPWMGCGGKLITVPAVDVDTSPVPIGYQSQHAHYCIKRRKRID